MDRPVTVWSAGSLLMALLNPAVVALGFLLYRERALILRRTGPLLVTLLVAALLALFTTAALASRLGLDPVFARAVIPRSVTTPIAIPIAGLLGADPGLTAALVVLTGVVGAVFGQPVLDVFRIEDPAARGMAVGASAHGIGTAALLADEPRSAAFSGVAFALMGAFSTLAASLPFCRDALLVLAGALP
jgi:putative effector of murein hydrolase